MIINKTYIEGIQKLLLDGYLSLNTKNLNKLSSTGKSDLNIAFDVISLNHCNLVINQFVENYSEAFSKTEAEIYRYLVAVYNPTGGSKDLVYTVYNGLTNTVTEPTESYLTTSDGKLLVDLLPEYNRDDYGFENESEWFEYITEPAVYKALFKSTNYSDNLYLEEVSSSDKKQYLQDELIKASESLDTTLITEFTHCVKIGLKILSKYHINKRNVG